MPQALTTAATSEGVAMVGDGAGGFVFPELHPAFDAMFALMKLLESLARFNTKLSEVVEQLPPYYLIRTQVNCPWEFKGKVMRILSEQYREPRRRGMGAGAARRRPPALPCAGGGALARLGAGAGR
jgi:mannose-1-phosphate guanylyltransferase/phosphomannomutase